MRGEDSKQEAMFSYVSPEKRVPVEHPLRVVRALVDTVLEEMSPRLAKLYADVGRPSIAPERLLRALLLQIFYSVRSERLLIEQLDYNLLFRWFVGLGMDEPVWNHAVFSKNRERLLNQEIAEAFQRWVSRDKFPRRKAQQRNASVHHRSRRAAVQEEPRQRGAVVLPGPRVDGEPTWVSGEDTTDPGDGHRRTRGSAGDGQTDPSPEAIDIGWGQGLRHT